LAQRNPTLPIAMVWPPLRFAPLLSGYAVRANPTYEMPQPRQKAPALNRNI
jgi:hypothetical protein